jgi:hypothetical protein
MGGEEEKAGLANGGTNPKNPQDWDDQVGSGGGGGLIIGCWLVEDDSGG